MANDCAGKGKTDGEHAEQAGSKPHAPGQKPQDPLPFLHDPAPLPFHSQEENKPLRQSFRDPASPDRQHEIAECETTNDSAHAGLPKDAQTEVYDRLQRELTFTNARMNDAIWSAHAS